MREQGNYQNTQLSTILIAAIILSGGFVRLYFSDANSYWLDEIYSVATYGIDNESIKSAIQLVAKDIHPPLYQFILYYWMAVFGDSEVATRTLSNIYIVGATMCLFFACRRLYGIWLGIIVALVFTVMYTPLYYGLETRSYAQTIFLSSLSTLLLIYALPRVVDKSWRDLMGDPLLCALLATNFALIMTHYYNVFFLVTQGIFVALFLLYRSERPLNALVNTAVIAAVPVGLMLLVWGPVMMSSYIKRSSTYVLEGFPRLPWDVLSEMVIEPNFGGQYAFFVCVALIIIVSISNLAQLRHRSSNNTPLFTLWFILATIIPVSLAFVAFLISGHERYSSRYFSFSVAPLSVLMVLGVFQVVDLIGKALRLPKTLVLVATGIATVSLALPGGVYALQRTKDDWRGIASAVVDRIKSEPNGTFSVYETSFRRKPTLDYYLGKYSPFIRVETTLPRAIERKNEPIQFTVPNTDYAIVVFTHHTTAHFPRTIEYLSDKMSLSESHLKKGRGYMVFTTHE